MSTVAVVLAAGEGRRMGGTKGLLPFAGRSFLAHVAALLARPGVGSVLAVVGAEAGRVRAGAGLPREVAVLENPAWRDGMLGSVLLGLAAAEERGADAVLLHPVDCPLVREKTVDRVLSALGGGAAIAVPSFEGRRGHPAGFARPAWPWLRAVSPHGGARAVLAAHPEAVVHVAGDPGCVLGIDTRADYERWVGPFPTTSR